MPKDLRDFWAGLLYLIAGAAAFYIAIDYEMGSAVSMGPGYFPKVLSVLLMAIGAISLVRSFLVEGEPVVGFAFGKSLYIALSVLVFALLAEGAGMAVAVAAVFMVSAVASSFFNWKQAALIAGGAALFCSLVFVKGLGVPLPIFGPWLGM
ncbi:tripartite tricarboxylate transporter TctB family protein [Limnobacter sp.]|uniref:tripartite tricarboxylate transporter TctB family protein n=1 Tax=Limnobacter sp. TaxID=2003368 RepID=UPI003517483B